MRVLLLTYKVKNSKVAVVDSTGKNNAREKGSTEMTNRCGAKKVIIEVKVK